MVDIPTEIWYRIARYLPEEELCHLLGVNNVFFELAMNLRWKEVSIETRSTLEAMRILNRLSDPYVARRLKHLRLRLTHVKAKHRANANNQEKAKDFKLLKQQFYLIVNRVFKIKRDQEEIDAALGMLDQKQSRPTFQNVMDAIIEATPHFANVTELTIDSWDLPPSYGNLETLFTAVWTSFGVNLRHLSLGGNLEGFRVLIESNPHFNQLEKLRVEFTNNVFRVDEAADLAILVNVIAPFINNVNSSLKALEIWSWADLDLSLFFQRLTILPVLNHLNVRMAFNRTLANPSGLQVLLCEGSRTLERLDLRLNPSGAAFHNEREEDLSQWLAHCLEDPMCFTKLRCLDIYPTTTVTGIDFLLASIQRASETLRHLTIRDRYLHPPEAALILELASRCKSLTYLRMNVSKLDAALLDLFAAHVPCVERLWLAVGDSSHDNDHGGLEQIFFRELQQRKYMNWKLRDISISQGGQDIDRETMEALARTIPSVTSFFGRGHMDLPL